MLVFKYGNYILEKNVVIINYVSVVIYRGKKFYECYLELVNFLWNYTIFLCEGIDVVKLYGVF